MSLDKVLVTLGGLGAIAFIVWFFWLWRREGVQAALTSSGYQEALILVKGGYTPDVIVVERGRPELYRRPRLVGDEDDAVSVDDRAARRGRAERAHLVVLRHFEVALARDDLERPEAEEENAEDRHRDDAEDRDPDRRLRGDAVGLLRPGIRREEPAREIRARARQPGSPRGARAVAPGRSGGKARRADRRAGGSGRGSAGACRRRTPPPTPSRRA